MRTNLRKEEKKMRERSLKKKCDVNNGNETGMLQKDDFEEYTISTSRLKPFHLTIKKLINKGCSIRSAWKIVSSEMNQPLTYTPFYLYVKKYIKN